MRSAPTLDSTISSVLRQLKVAPRGQLDIICFPLKTAGVAQLVERLVANESWTIIPIFSHVLSCAFS
jgi:hypothetical protein